MRQIGSIPDPSDAERFGDHLLTVDIPNNIEEGSGGWAVWVERDDDLDRARGELDAFLRDPANAKYNGATRVAGRIRSEQEKKQQRLRKRFVDVRTSWGQARQWVVPVTLGLIGACLIVAVLTRLGGNDGPLLNSLLIEPMRVVVGEGGRELWAWNGWSAVSRGQVWRVVTPMLLHFSILHLLFNLFWLRDLGAMIESKRGMWTMAALVLVAAVLSNVGQYAWSGWPRFGGMSGVVYALLGYVWVKGRYEPHLGLGISRESVWIMLAWLGLGMTGLVGPIANAAHLIGLIAGAAFAYAPIAWRRLRRAAR
jgi:GlpG protein